MLNTAIIEADGEKGASSVPIGAYNRHEELSTTMQEVATGVVIIGAAAASFLLTAVPRRLGYQRTIALTALLYLAGTALTLKSSVPMLITGRSIIGLAVGMANTTVPTLLTEIADVRTRGTLAAMHQLLTTIGIFASGLAGYGFVHGVDNGWKPLFALGLIPPGIQLLTGKWLIPESPRWLISHGKVERARAQLLALRSFAHDVDHELAEIQSSMQATAAQASASWREVLGGAHYRRPLMIGIGMLAFTCFSGINTVVFYSSTILGFAGVNSPIGATCAVFGLNVLSTAGITYWADRLGRRLPLLVGGALAAAALGLLSFSLLVLDEGGLQAGLAVTAVLLYVLGFAVSWGAMCFVVLNEVAPTAARAKIAGVAVGVNFSGNVLLSLSTLSMVRWLGGGSDAAAKKRGVGYLYIAFATICVLGWLFVAKQVPETRGTSLEQVASEMDQAAAKEADEARALLADDSDGDSNAYLGGLATDAQATHRANAATASPAISHNSGISLQKV